MAKNASFTSDVCFFKYKKRVAPEKLYSILVRMLPTGRNTVKIKYKN